jgi:predicted nucleic acid-binding protein
MKLYLDNCCFNRPFDDQSIVRNRLETEARMHVQSQIQKGFYELIWSYILEYENSENPHPDRQVSTLKWKTVAQTHCAQTQSIVSRAKKLEAIGIRAKDALHIACAIESGADFMLSTDDKILNKNIEEIRIINPIDFVRIEAKNDN